MPKTPPLHELIHSLSTNEKRYFKLFTANSSGDKNYQKLFNAIEKEKINDPKQLKKTVRQYRHEHKLRKSLPAKNADACAKEFS